jgi:hypothetical protein
MGAQDLRTIVLGVLSSMVAAGVLWLTAKALQWRGPLLHRSRLIRLNYRIKKLEDVVDLNIDRLIWRCVFYAFEGITYLLVAIIMYGFEAATHLGAWLELGAFGLLSVGVGRLIAALIVGHFYSDIMIGGNADLMRLRAKRDKLVEAAKR